MTQVVNLKYDEIRTEKTSATADERALALTMDWAATATSPP